MASLFTQLTDLLTEQLRCFDELILLSEQKKDVIIANDAEGLSKITSDENALVGRLTKLDKNRTELMSEIGGVVGIPDNNYTLTALCAVLREQDIENHELLAELIDKTRDKLDTLRALNEQNKSFVESSLEYIDFSVNVIRSANEPEKHFYNTGGDEITRQSSFFDARQ